MRDTESFVCISFSAPQDEQDILVGALNDLPISGFEQFADHLSAYVAGSLWTERIQWQISEILSSINADQNWTVTQIPEENWNALWQSKIDPVQAGLFYIHPSWTCDAGMRPGSLPIVIDPRMSFGTGHHESTRLALRHMSDETDLSGAVLDVGTGTGILSMAAALKGASRVLAVDTDSWCISNASDNLRLNNITSVSLRQGSLDCVVDERFSLILANINKSVLTEMIPLFSQYSLPDSRIILSGLLVSDEADILSYLKASGFVPTGKYTEGEWWSVKAEPAR